MIDDAKVHTVNADALVPIEDIPRPTSEKRPAPSDLIRDTTSQPDSESRQSTRMDGDDICGWLASFPGYLYQHLVIH